MPRKPPRPIRSVSGKPSNTANNHKGHFAYSNKEIIHALNKCKGLVYTAAKMIGCTPDTIRYRARQFKEIRDAIRYKRGEFLDTVENQLHQAVGRGEPWAITISLKLLGHKRGYIEKKEKKIDETSTRLQVSLENKMGQWIDDLELPLVVQEAILDAVRKRREAMEKKESDLKLITHRLSSTTLKPGFLPEDEILEE